MALRVIRSPIVTNPDVIALVHEKQMEGRAIERFQPQRSVLCVAVLAEDSSFRFSSRHSFLVFLAENVES